MHFARSSLIAGFVAAWCAVSAFGASITGTVKGPDGAPFRAAFVQARNRQTRITVSVLSNNQGHYRIPDLPAGDYEIQIRALGFQAQPQRNVKLSASQQASYDFALQKAEVRWSDLTIYQGRKLLPEAKGKQELFADCTICHAFQTKMAAVKRDEAGWEDRMNYMRTAMAFGMGRVNDQRASEIVSYLSTVFSPDSTLPKSPEEVPGYKETLRPISDEALNIVYVEYEAGRMPWSAAPDNQGYLWIPFYGNTNMVGRLDPKTGEVKQYPVPEKETAGVHSAKPADDGTVWFTEFALNKLGRIDPATGSITMYPDPGGDMAGMREGKHTVRIDPDGNAWSTGSPLSRLDVKTRKYTHFPDVPSSYGITPDKSGNMWFTVLRDDGPIGMVDRKSLKVKQWHPPTKGRPQRIAIDDQGMVWFSERGAGKLGRFDPKTETFKEFDLPGPAPTPYALGIDREHYIWYASTEQDRFGRLNPKTGDVVEYPVPHSEVMAREFFLDSQGRMWFAAPTSSKVGYFYLAEGNMRAAR